MPEQQSYTELGRQKKFIHISGTDYYKVGQAVQEISGLKKAKKWESIDRLPTETERKKNPSLRLVTEFHEVTK